MEWVLALVLLVMAYAIVALAVYRKRNELLERLRVDVRADGELVGVQTENPEVRAGLNPVGRFLVDNVVFYGPIIAIKTSKVGFFDKFTVLSLPLRIYGTIGVIVVAIVSVLITASLFFALNMTIVAPPAPTGIYKPQNILLIPGLNEFVPSTIAVWLALIIAIGIHEFGHGILCRIEKIAVKGVGALIAVVPIGFFVEPDEAELDKQKGLPKMRMFGAGITNNLAIGVVCIVLMVALLGTAVPTGAPVIQGIYQNYSADIAGVPPNSVIVSLNGADVYTRNEVSALLNQTRPGDTISLGVLSGGVEGTYNLTLTDWPDTTGPEPRTSGFMGIYYYDGNAVLDTIKTTLSPIGFLRIMTVPFDTTFGGQLLRIIAFDTPDTANYVVPAPWIFWGLVHLLFWVGWININVGIFNALPMVPLDGGYILKEAIDRLFEKRGLAKYSTPVVSVISSVMLVMLFALITLPYLLNG
ncbi:MAG: site-2 protease family protein [Methanoregulaceae archaeon]|nr:site-2 protease family protein [Methanoregulaceae archaeon]